MTTQWYNNVSMYGNECVFSTNNMIVVVDKENVTAQFEIITNENMCYSDHIVIPRKDIEKYAPSYEE